MAYFLRGKSVAYDNIAAGSVAGRELIAGTGSGSGELTVTVVGGNFVGGVVDPTTDNPYENDIVAEVPPNPERLTP